MARVSVTLKLSNDTQTRLESAVVYSVNLRWTSQPGGWLSDQGGVWNETPLGVHIMNPANSVHVADCLGLHFDAATVNASGRAEYPSIGAVGTWTVIDTNDS